MYSVTMIINGKIEKKYRYPTQERLITHSQNVFSTPACMTLHVVDRQGRIWFEDQKPKFLMQTLPYTGADFWQERFCFHANDQADADNKASNWAHYQEFSQAEVRATPSPVDWVCHDDWVS